MRRDAAVGLQQFTGIHQPCRLANILFRTTQVFDAAFGVGQQRFRPCRHDRSQFVGTLTLWLGDVQQGQGLLDARLSRVEFAAALPTRLLFGGRQEFIDPGAASLDCPAFLGELLLLCLDAIAQVMGDGGKIRVTCSADLLHELPGFVQLVVVQAFAGLGELGGKLATRMDFGFDALAFSLQPGHVPRPCGSTGEILLNLGPAACCGVGLQV